MEQTSCYTFLASSLIERETSISHLDLIAAGCSPSGFNGMYALVHFSWLRNFIKPLWHIGFWITFVHCTSSLSQRFCIEAMSEDVLQMGWGRYISSVITQKRCIVCFTLVLVE